jgi:hypothetical protein
MNEVNVKKLEGSFVSYKYPCKQVILIKLSERIQSPLSIYCLSSFSSSLLVCIWFPISNKLVSERSLLVDPREMTNSTFPFQFPHLPKDNFDN